MIHEQLHYDDIVEQEVFQLQKLDTNFFLLRQTAEGRWACSIHCLHRIPNFKKYENLRSVHAFTKQF